MSRYIFVDIETLPAADPLTVPLPRAPRTYKDPEKIAAYVAEHSRTAYRDTALNPLLGRVLCIGVALDEGAPVVIYAVDANGQPDERMMLEQLAEVVGDERSIWVGHNLAAFDLRWLYYRARKYGLPFADSIPWDKWDKRVEDTMDLAMGPNPRGDMQSLSALAEYFGIGPGKLGMDGSMVYDAWLDGRVAEILAYCAHDVWMTREVHRALRFEIGRAHV